jgi:hypothetical protein
LKDIAVSTVRLTQTLGGPVYLVDSARYHAVTRETLPAVTRAEAREIASLRTDIEIVSIALVEEVPIDDEYRGGELPAYRVTLAEENAALYVGTTTRRVRALRTEAWRWFDFLWSLHIMDNDEREDFNQ